MNAKFKVRIFSYFGDISIKCLKFHVVQPWPRSIFEKKYFGVQVGIVPRSICLAKFEVRRFSRIGI